MASGIDWLRRLSAPALRNPITGMAAPESAVKSGSEKTFGVVMFALFRSCIVGCIQVRETAGRYKGRGNIQWKR
jgi:hypothetical protein